VNEKLSQWPFGQLLKYLEYKLQVKGITLEKANEAYSSQTCPVCTRRRKPSGRVYRCKGVVMNNVVIFMEPAIF
jgi:putative transposase